MKQTILNGVVNIIVLGLALLLGLGAYQLYQAVKFQQAVNENMLKTQRSQIEQTCAAIAAEKAGKEKDEKAK